MIPPKKVETHVAKPKKQTSGSDELPDDIRQQVIKDFGPELADLVYQHLQDRIPKGLPNGTRPRHLRCILFLAKGDRALLDEYIELCLRDTRDVMLHAEYESDANEDFVRVRDFGKPFDQSRLPRHNKKADEKQ